MRNLELTELERVKIENFALRIMLMQQQIQHAQIERQTFIQQLEDKYPGYVWRDPHGMVPIEETASDPYPEFTPH